jgi:peptidoglycan/xylan/chitin deacetylase (PgdA/CDA1 family)
LEGEIFGLKYRIIILAIAVVFSFMGFAGGPRYGDCVERDASGEKVFYLTFDAHDDRTNVEFILSVLEQYKIKATFFLTGYFIKKYPDLALKISRAGHAVGNHTLTHEYYTSEARLLREMKVTNERFRQLTGNDMNRLWRAPYLQYEKASFRWVLKSGRKLGYRHIGVSLETHDWVIRRTDPRYLTNEEFLYFFRNLVNTNRYIPYGVRRKYLSYPRQGPAASYSGLIMLMHGGTYRRADRVRILPQVIEHLQSRGYRFGDCRKFEQGM